MASDLHRALVAEVDDRMAYILGEQLMGRSLVDALRAVVELHVPDPESPWACDHCSTTEIPYPCSTIRTIAEALGVTEGDRS